MLCCCNILWGQPLFVSLASGYRTLQLEFLCSALAALGEWNGCFWLLLSPSVYCRDQSCVGLYIRPCIEKALDHFQYTESLGMALREGVLMKGDTIGMKRVTT